MQPVNEVLTLIKAAAAAAGDKLSPAQLEQALQAVADVYLPKSDLETMQQWQLCQLAHLTNVTPEVFHQQIHDARLRLEKTYGLFQERLKTAHRQSQASLAPKPSHDLLGNLAVDSSLEHMEQLSHAISLVVADFYHHSLVYAKSFIRDAQYSREQFLLYAVLFEALAMRSEKISEDMAKKREAVTDGLLESLKATAEDHTVLAEDYKALPQHPEVLRLKKAEEMEAEQAVRYYIDASICFEEVGCKRERDATEAKFEMHSLQYHPEAYFTYMRFTARELLYHQNTDAQRPWVIKLTGLVSDLVLLNPAYVEQKIRDFPKSAAADRAESLLRGLMLEHFFFYNYSQKIGDSKRREFLECGLRQAVHEYARAGLPVYAAECAKKHQRLIGTPAVTTILMPAMGAARLQAPAAAVATREAKVEHDSRSQPTYADGRRRHSAAM